MSVNKHDNDQWNEQITDQSPSSQSEHADMPDRSAVHGSKVKSKKAGNEYLEWTKALVIAIVLVFIIRQFLFSPFIVDGASMQPNFETGERLIVNKLIYNIGKPKYGDVIVFNVPEQGRKFIKRVIGVPGDTISLKGDDLYINDKLIDEPYIREVVAAKHAQGMLYNGSGNQYNYPNSKNGETVVPEGTVFAMGDNRGDSTDSRYLGFINEKEIIGRAEVIFWPLNQIKFINHY
ncbi:MULTISPECIES: signal peptidase I [unclassified Paenibacillus]|uniref:signal peptidase I n=1 Tax=unclassified Paenibacillus TaxID=185978 RepID=UPI002F413211